MFNILSSNFIHSLSQQAQAMEQMSIIGYSKDEIARNKLDTTFFRAKQTL